MDDGSLGYRLDGADTVRLFNNKILFGHVRLATGGSGHSNTTTSVLTINVSSFKRVSCNVSTTGYGSLSIKLTTNEGASLDYLSGFTSSKASPIDIDVTNYESIQFTKSIGNEAGYATIYDLTLE